MICISSCTNSSGELANKLEQQQAEIQNLKKKLNEVEDRITPEFTEEINDSDSALNCNFEDFRYEEKGNDSVYLRLHSRKGNLIKITGQDGSSAYSFGVEARIEGNKLVIISGNATGELSLILDCETLVGDLTRKKRGDVHSFDLIKKK